MESQGYSQSQIAKLLGITQASVSKYLASGSEKAYAALKSLSVRAEDADGYASVLAEDVKDGLVRGTGTILSLWTSLLARGSVCSAHRAEHPELADCEVCMDLYGANRGGLSESVRMVSEGVRILERSDTFASVMPEVSVNLAYVPEGGDTLEEVVAVPGRIVRVLGSPRAVLAPELGASKHMARVLLFAASKVPRYRSVVNLKFDRRIEKSLTRLGLRVVKTSGAYQEGTEDPSAEAIGRAVVKAKGGFDAVIDVGGRRVEPNLYLFSETPKQVAELAVRISMFYSAREVS